MYAVLGRHGMLNREINCLYHICKRFTGQNSIKNNVNGKSLPKVVIAGSGWAAIHFAKQLNRIKFDTYIVSPKNFFTFTPLLPFVSSGKILPEACTESLHYLFNGTQPKLIFSEGFDVDFDGKSLICHNISANNDSVEVTKIPYDYLVIAVGAVTNTFNIPNVDKYAYFLKDISDAKAIYNRICSNCEYASYPNLPVQKVEDLCRIMIVGGGPTGVETAACINETIVKSLSIQFPHLKQYLKIYLVESGSALLVTFSPKISKYTLKTFENNDIMVKLNTRMERVEQDYCEFVDNVTGTKTRIGHGIVIWVSGLTGRPFTKKLIEKLSKSGMQNQRNSLSVDQYFRVRGADDVFALGDCAQMIPDKMSDQAEAIANLLGNKLTAKKLNSFRNVLLNKYPQMSKLKWKGPYNNDNLSLDEFKKLLIGIDSGFRGPFPTAQNAKQEGIYLANVFNQFLTHNSCGLNTYELLGQNSLYVKPFCEVWKGSIAYVGMNRTVFKLPFIELTGKLLLQTLWKFITIDMLFTYRSKTALLLSWMLDRMFGKARANLQHSKPHYK
ncbi:NADH dehydrogenase [Babesia microti strain RI]|uniref:NADH:ubiquinone reductase (non-electrogenic) n=1 Tax=Babesia microti (strain RI) TaxID=1133968 RepID=I7J5C6_BABMR|nr:NADH dehydrogenase [Babesia microti strain RI]CCF72752.1 NADH dehydrogenase [Babesia microti strain RI]|eukprot:XP_012647361.1 NADH dehydrogenase [Babesia microti strain RI]